MSSGLNSIICKLIDISPQYEYVSCMSSKLRRISTSDAVFIHFKDLVRGGKLKSGDALASSRELTQELGISRFALREGLAKLEALGIITIQHGKGAFVTDHINQQSLKDIFLSVLTNPETKLHDDLIEARIILGRASAELAAQRRTEEDLASLRHIIEESQNAMDDPKLFAELDEKYHNEIARISDNQFLLYMQDTLHAYVLDFIRQNVRRPDVRERAIEYHKQILNAIKNKNGKVAMEAVEAHIRICKADYDQQFTDS